jgi:Zn-dependent protease
MFIQVLQTDPVFYITVVTVVIFSVTLHELAHGWAAIWQGDDTPTRLGHMTPNPVVHMGPVSFVAAFLIGLAWGQMPVNPSNFRSRYGQAMVSFAGPAMNLVLALLSLTGFALWQRFGAGSQSEFHENLMLALYIMGVYNIILAMLNLMPVPPLDGSRVLANFHRGYARWLDRHLEAHQIMFIAALVIFMLMNRTDYGPRAIAGNAADAFIRLLRG